MRLNLFVSLWNYLYYTDPKGLEGTLREIAENDFGVELWPAVYSFDPYRPAYHPSFPCAQGYDRIYDLFKGEHRVRLRKALSGMRSVWHSRAFEEEPKQYAAVESYEEEIDTASNLGSEAISVHYIGQELTTRGFSGKNPSFVQKVLDYAQRRGVRIALETRDFESLKRATGEFGNLGVCLDPACIRDCSPYGLKDFMEAVQDRICFLHLYDSRGVHGHLTPGTGDIPREDWKYMLESLSEIDFQGAAVLEIHPPPEKSGQSAIEAAIEAREFFERLE